MTAAEEYSLRNLIEACEVIPAHRSIAERAAALGRTRSIKAIDLLIAATALEHKLTLVTKNIRDFKDIPDLEIQDHF